MSLSHVSNLLRKNNANYFFQNLEQLTFSMLFRICPHPTLSYNRFLHVLSSLLIFSLLSIWGWEITFNLYFIDTGELTSLNYCLLYFAAFIWVLFFSISLSKVWYGSFLHLVLMHYLLNLFLSILFFTLFWLLIFLKKSSLYLNLFLLVKWKILITLYEFCIIFISNM